MTVKLESQFKITYGNKKLHNKENLESGKTLVISSTGTDNGHYGFFDTPTTITPPVISVPSTGSVGESFVQLHPCAVDDNCLVLYPKKEYDIEYLFYIATEVRRAKWRYMYGRQITPYRLGKLDIIASDDYKPAFSWNNLAKKVTPKRNLTKNVELKEPTLKEFNITELFDLQRGHFHAIDKLKQGKYPTVSRVADDNGLVGFYQKPKKAKVFPRFLITVSTVTGVAFLQFKPFIATDNVIVCIPKSELRLTTLLYIQSVINKVKWRYSYGRQCYKRVLKKTVLTLPVIATAKIDEDYIQKMVINQPYWKAYNKKILENTEKLAIST